MEECGCSGIAMRKGSTSRRVMLVARGSPRCVAHKLMRAADRAELGPGAGDSGGAGARPVVIAGGPPVLARRGLGLPGTDACEAAETRLAGYEWTLHRPAVDTRLARRFPGVRSDRHVTGASAE